MRRHLAIAVVIALIGALAVGPTVAAADETRTGGTVIVEEDETVEDLSVFGGTVIVDGSTEGELRVVGGRLRSTATPRISRYSVETSGLQGT
ncbi:hypothetical protein ACFQH2_11415 [Natronoarchaeum sp. GCM10025703]|uniref:hypothetical protein n=1 Tax=Natronoarchaeum sp. GCM10025703 TaxID=3252685 RepID=UPI003611EB8E